MSKNNFPIIKRELRLTEPVEQLCHMGELYGYDLLESPVLEVITHQEAMSLKGVLSRDVVPEILSVVDNSANEPIDALTSRVCMWQKNNKFRFGVLLDAETKLPVREELLGAVAVKSQTGKLPKIFDKYAPLIQLGSVKKIESSREVVQRHLSALLPTELCLDSADYKRGAE